MAFIHQKSCECLKTELDLFTLPPTQTSIESGKWVQYKPVSALTDDAPIEFVVPGHGEEYTDLSQTLLHVVATVTKEDNSAFAAADKTFGPVNNWLHSLFSQVDVYLNQKLVTPQNNTYPYRAYIENLLNYDAGAKKSHLQCGLWAEDTAGHMEDVDDTNDGIKKRRAFVAQSKYTDMVAPLHIDLCNQEKFLLNGVEMRLRLVRSRDAFALMGTNAAGRPKVRIQEVNLLVRRCRISPSVLLAHAKTLDSGTAKYPITRVELKTVTLPVGIQSKTIDNLFLGQLPKRVIIGMVTNTAFNGDYTKNPFNFQHFNNNFLSLYVDGEQIPSIPLKPDFTNKYVLAYHTLLSTTRTS